ncbi:MAG: hypothetical protein JJ863_08945 [Deltaproteobacteria bacterium]|nr:hypothetical protein [Deltaproteobacteria bacterium]
MTPPSCPLCERRPCPGHEELSSEEANAFAGALCPKCSGGAQPRSVSADRLHYRCSCGVTWTEPR